MIELESRDALAAWEDGWRSQSFELVAVDKGLQDVLLDIEVQEPGSKLIERCSAAKNQVVTILHLGKEKPVLATGSVAFALFEKWSQTGEPFLAATQKIVCSQRIGQLLKPLWLAASQECVGTLLKIDPFFAHPISQPVMLIQTDPR
jgi:hypothetical protein